MGRSNTESTPPKSRSTFEMHWPVPSKHVRLAFSGMVSLPAKVRNVPDLSTIDDSLRVIHMEAKSANNKTAQSLAKVKGELHGNIAEVNENTAVGEETKTLEKETAEVSKTAADAMREVKNK